MPFKKKKKIETLKFQNTWKKKGQNTRATKPHPPSRIPGFFFLKKMSQAPKLSCLKKFYLLVKKKVKKIAPNHPKQKKNRLQK